MTSTSSSDLRAQLLELGFNFTQARAAVEAGNKTVEAATEWIFESNSVGNSRESGTTLHLRRDQENDAFDAELQQALAESTRSQSASVLPKPVELEKAVEPSPATPADASTESTTASTSKKIKINIIRQEPSIHTTAALPLTSRHKEEETQALNATRVAEANKRAEQLKKEKLATQRARQRALDDAKQDREKMKLKTHAAIEQSNSGSSLALARAPLNTQATSPNVPAVTSAPSARSHTMVQLRLKNGAVLKRSFESKAPLRDLFELARSEDGNIGSADISLIQPFPRQEFTISDSDLTLLDAGLCPSCSLNVFVQTPIPAPQPITPGAWLPTDVEMEDVPVDHTPDMDMPGQDYGIEDGDETGDNVEGGNENTDEDEDENENEGDIGEDGNHDDGGDEDDDEMMHAMPVFNPHQNPMVARGRGRGRGGGVPFSGAGHSLGSGATVSTAGHSEAPVAPEYVVTDEARRQRILDAMANRKANQGEDDVKDLHARPKKSKERVVPSLQSLCSYEVAVMLTAKDSRSSKHLRSLGENVGPQAAEAIIQELIKLKQLDQLTLKGLYRCPIGNIVLDAYSRATDSLMDCIGASQARSLTYLSLKECTFLTDKGFSNISRFTELEYLDLSHCRVTDKTLEYTLNLANLGTLQLSGTKVTSNGMARIIAEAAWKSTLHTLDLSYCQGINGSSVLVNLEELSNIMTLKLNNTQAFDQHQLREPDRKAFTRLLNLDLARTLISDDELVRLLPGLKAAQVLNLSSCMNVSTMALERCARELSALHNITFPNREHDLLSVLPVAAALPLTQLDLTGFLYVNDHAILTLAAAVNLQVLSLAGTKLTDLGSAVFVHMSSLKELSLDRTCIGDKTIEYLRDLGRVEVLSLHRCERLTTIGIGHLGKCAFFSIKLKRLNLGFNKYIHDEALSVFTRCQELNTLNLEYTDVSEKRALRLQDSLPNLKQLRIQGVSNGAVFEENPRPVFT